MAFEYLSPMQLSANLKKAGHDFELLIIPEEPKWINKMKDYNPDYILFSASAGHHNYILSLAREVRKYVNVPIILGGMYPTFDPDAAIKHEEVDMICMGEGDVALVEFADNSKRTNIKGMGFKKDGKVIMNDYARYVEDLDSLPFMDRSIYDKYKILQEIPAKKFMTGRGCPYPCTYCINRTQKEIYKGKGAFVRYKSVDKILSEIKEIVTNYRVKEIGFNDDTFTLNAVRVREFCNKYPQVVGNVPFYVNARVNAVSRETFILLGKAGCKRVNMGVECGDPKIRNEILERDMTDEQIIQTFNWARDAGIETYAFNMIGLPYETKESIQKTIDLNRKINPDYLGCSIFTALPGTPLYELCKKNGWLAPEYSTSYFQDSNMIHPNFTVDELKVFRDNFGFEVYKGIRPMRAYIDKFDKTLIKFSPYVKTRSILLRFGAKHVMNKKWEKRRSKIDFDKSLENINIA